MITINTTEIRGWVREAGAIARHYFGHAAVEWKTSDSPVTVADREIERFLRDNIQAAYPGHGFIGEEYGTGGLRSDYLWTIDPIDGTRAFVEGLPSWCVSVALLRKRQPVFGMIHIPLYDDWTYTDGDDVICNGRIVTGQLKSTWADNSYVFWRSDAGARYDLRFNRIMTMASSASHLAYTARGASVATIIHDSYVWDIAAGAAFLAKQGGEIRFASGELVDFAALDLTQPITGLYVAGHPAVVARLIPLIRERDTLRRHPAW